MPRKETELYPDFQAEIDIIKEQGLDEALLNRIIKKHFYNRDYNWNLHKRYEALQGKLPIFERKPRFEEDENPINNRLNNDFMGEIIDFKTGYFAGKPFVYSYSDSKESKQDTGGEAERDIASKTLSDFVTRNNMYDINIDVTKFAAIAGYAGRQFYFDTDGNERVMALPSYETIILSETNITEPLYGIRYYKTEGIDGSDIWRAEFDDGQTIRFFEGSLHGLVENPDKQMDNLFGYCAIQGIPNNSEMLGDAEKVMELIDAYDRTTSDVNNEVEGFANAYMAFENVNMDEDEIKKGQRTGAFSYYTGGQGGNIHFITKDINDAFVEHHLDRIEENIYRFSKTPNLTDDAFNTATGIALKFKLTGLETKCGMFQAKMTSADVYMFKLLAGSWTKKQIDIDPLQCYVTFKRNFPHDIQGEATAVQALINTGFPKRASYEQLTFVDDIEEVMQLIEEEKDDIPSLLLEDNFGEDEEIEEIEEEETQIV